MPRTQPTHGPDRAETTGRTLGALWTLALALAASACVGVPTPADPPVPTPEATEAAPFGGLEEREVEIASPTSPDGLWVARRLEDVASTKGDVTYTRLLVERTDGSVRWVAANEAVPDGICGEPAVPIGWWVEGGFFVFGTPGCGEGCVRFAEPYDIRRLDLTTGDVVALPSGTLSPDGHLLARLQRHESGRWALAIGDIGRDTAARPGPAGVEIPEVAAGASVHLGGIVWSPDGRRLALAELEGDCPTETEGAIHLFDVSSAAHVARHGGRFAVPSGIARPGEWAADGRLRVETLPHYGVEPRANAAWWLDPATGAFTPVER